MPGRYRARRDSQRTAVGQPLVSNDRLATADDSRALAHQRSDFSGSVVAALGVDAKEILDRRSYAQKDFG
jgi:hypothetical protein